MRHPLLPLSEASISAPWAMLCLAVLLGVAHVSHAGPDRELTAGVTGERDDTSGNRWPDGRFAEHCLTGTLAGELASAHIAGRNVAIAPVVGQKPHSLVQRSLLRALLAADARVCGGEARVARGDSCWQVRYGIVDLRLDGAREGSRLLWTDRYRRRLRADLILELTSPSGETTWVSPVVVDVSEILPSSLAKSLEDRDVIPRHGIPRDSRLLEGLALTAVLASFLLLAR